ncbi:MAG: hypothetical protein GF307_02745 [candidate division Zixibacteria bacterium]|nr:hypothetical protein [candidate division Zixibacteria bacterium]
MKHRSFLITRILGVMVILSFMIVLTSGCSDSSSTNPDDGDGDGSGGIDVTFTRYTQLVQEIAPPAYTSGGGLLKPYAPADSVPNADSMWWATDSPMLEKIFGTEEPTSLYRNINELDELVEQCEMLADSGSGTYDVYMEEEGDTVSVECVVESLTAKVPVPEQCQPVLGRDSLDLDYYVGCEIEEYDLFHHTAFKVTATEEWFYTYFSMPKFGPGGGLESSLNLAYRNHVTDSIDIKAVFFKYQNNMADTVMWVYNILTVDSDNFKYKMTSYSDEEGYTRSLGCTIGGGDKDSEFVLRFRSYQPPDAAEPDSNWQADQVFGPSYSDLGQNLSQNYLNEYPLTEMYGYDDLPTGLLTSPMDPADALCPWGP